MPTPTIRRLAATVGLSIGLVGGSTALASPLVDISGNNASAAGDNQASAQACHNQVPVNALGVQVPVQEVAGGLTGDVIGSDGDDSVDQSETCGQSAGQENQHSATSTRDEDRDDGDFESSGAESTENESSDDDSDTVVAARGNNVNAGSDNQADAQACHLQVPVNALGVQVPVQELELLADLGLLDESDDGIDGSKDCGQTSAQANSEDADAHTDEH